MRRDLKQNLEDLLETMCGMHQVLLKEKDRTCILSYLEECQQAAVVIGEKIETHAPGLTKMVELLEEYCEVVYLLSGAGDISREDVAKLDQYMDQVKGGLQQILGVYHVAFFPYKVEMWDSLESIWRACKEDPRCECVVVPLPYYQRNEITKCWEPHYDGELFSHKVSVVKYSEYSLADMSPDVGYIHNPYDGSNYVTSVDPAYYSDELKKYVKKLVYVPYFVTSGFFSQIYEAAYKNMDYMVIQSQGTKEYFKETPFYDKLLPLGSPKLDSVIKTCKNGGRIPEEWNVVLEGKKCLMLNTSIGCLLNDGSYMLKKLRFVFDVFASQQRVVLIWRPHPLLEATIRSMRMDLLSEYRALLAYFKESKIGVLDQTPDLENTIALSDGYLGEESTSVVNLFQVVGKPVFVLNNYIIRRYTEEERRRVIFADILELQGKTWATAFSYNALLQLNPDTREYELAGCMKNRLKWWKEWTSLSAKNKQIFVASYMGKNHIKFDTRSHKFTPLFPLQEEYMGYRKIVSYKKKIFYLPGRYSHIMEYNTDKDRWKLHAAPVEALVGSQGDTEWSTTFDYGVFGTDLWLCGGYTNRVLQFNMETGEHVIHHVGEQENGYWGIVAEDEYIWMGEVQTGNIVRYHRYTKQVDVFTMPETFNYRQIKSEIRFAHLALVDMGQWIIAIPAFSNGTVKIEKATGISTMMISDFWNDAENISNDYCPEIYFSATYYGNKDESNIMVQRTSDGAMATINVENETFETYYPMLSENGYKKLTDGEDGFEQIRSDSIFCRRESSVFSLDGFLEDLVSGKLDNAKERQMKAMEKNAANLDGTCGEKVHEFMMNVLSESDVKKVSTCSVENSCTLAF